MATKAKSRSSAKPRTRYEDDLYTWVQEQVALLRAGRLDEVDALNVAEELADVGKSEMRALRSSLAVLIQHLLKWDHQPSHRSLSWVATINEQRRQVQISLDESPGLKSKLSALIVQAYASGRDFAAADTDLDFGEFAESCPYTFDDLMTREIAFEQKSQQGR